MTTFEERERSLETKFFHDEETRFRVTARRRKLLGIWAAEQMHMDDEAALAYALEIVRYGVEDTRDGAVVKKILADLQKAGIERTEQQVRDEMNNLQKVAEEEILGEV